MRANWTEVPKDRYVGQWAALYVTLNKRGEIIMSRKTYEWMGAPKAFVVMFDSTNNRIGLKPAVETTRNARRVGPRGRHGGKRIICYRLMAEHRIALPETMQFTDITIDEDGIIVLDLRTAKISLRSVSRKEVLAAHRDNN